MSNINKSRSDALTDEQIEQIARNHCHDFPEADVMPYLKAAIYEALDAASPVEQPAPITAQTALDAIETFEIVGENNDSREPNADDRFILTEYIAHLFGGYPVERPAVLPVGEFRQIIADARGAIQVGNPELAYEKLGLLLGAGVSDAVIADRVEAAPHAAVEQPAAAPVYIGCADPEWRARHEKPAAAPIWRCFHCDEVFADPESATLHFGRSERESPACTIDVPEYRAMEQRMHAYNEEDSELHRAIYRLQAQHQTELQREEEKGYARGLADGMKEEASTAPAPADERAAFEAKFPPPGGVKWNGTKYAVDDEYVNSYRVERFGGQWEAWQAARATSANETVPKWVFDGLVNTLQPAWDYIQTHQERFNAQAGDDKNAILVKFFMRAASANETGAEGAIVVPIELSSVAETLSEGDGFWRSCSGCHETNEGHETGHYPYSKILKCHLGGGCSECGGIGAVWDDTDYTAMGDAFERAGLLNGRDAPARASAPAETHELPMMRNAFRVTEVSGDPDPAKQSFAMRFSFPSIEALHAADDEWNKFVAPAQADAREGLTDALIRRIATQYCEYDAAGRTYNILRYECEEDFFNCIRELLAAHPGLPKPHADATGSVRAFPDELTDDLRHVLGFPNFRCGPYAHLMVAAGADIKPKSEDEQAHVLHWLVKLVLDHGEHWADVAEEEMNAMRAKIAASAGDAS